MSMFIETKNINQCRTYFRKLIKTFKTVPRMITFFKSTIPEY